MTLPKEFNAILYPALSHRFIITFGTKSNVDCDFDSNLISRQIVKINYSLSSKTVNFELEEPDYCADTLCSIMNLENAIASINILNGNDGTKECVGVSLYDLKLENHYVERDYGKSSEAVKQIFRFGFKNNKAIKYTPAAIDK